MHNILNPENPIISFLNQVVDLIILGVLWTLCSIPVITVGASSAALCYAYNKHFVKKEGYAAKLFFQAFRENFKQATVLWLIMVAVLAFLGADYYLARVGMAEKSFLSIPLVLVIAISIFVLMWSQYAFAYIARFENDTRTVIKNTVLIMLVNFPWSFLLLALFAAVFLFFPLLLFFAVSVYIVFANMIHQRVFSKYIKPEEEEAEEDAEF